MSKHALEVLLDSRPRFKILKFLFRNMERGVTIKDLAEHTQEDQTTTRKEIIKLLEIKLLRQEGKKSASATEYRLNKEFEFFSELRDLILKSSPAEKRHLIESINKLGRIKFAAVGGIFMDKESKDPLAVDLMIVVDDPDRRKLQIFLKSLEAEVGKEIKFAVMDREEFLYRMAMFDRFVRVLLEGPHEKLINRLGVGL